jgi:hypothetical protein
MADAWISISLDPISLGLLRHAAERLKPFAFEKSWTLPKLQEN